MHREFVIIKFLAVSWRALASMSSLEWSDNPGRPLASPVSPPAAHSRGRGLSKNKKKKNNKGNKLTIILLLTGRKRLENISFARLLISGIIWMEKNSYIFINWASLDLCSTKKNKCF